MTVKLPPSTPAQPFVSIVIVAWNKWELTQDCLLSIHRLRYGNFETIVIDNASTDGIGAQCEEEFPSVRVELQAKNLGFARGANAGLRLALDEGKARYVLVLNNDTRLPPDLLEALVGEAERDDRIGAVTCRVDGVDSPGQIWSMGSRKNRWLAPIDFAPWPIDLRLARTARDVDYILGAVMLLRVAALRTAGLFDERYFFYYEDLDLSLRLARAGYRLRYIPAPTVLHIGAASSGRETALSEYHQGRSSAIFYGTHGRQARVQFALYRAGVSAWRVVRHCLRGRWREAQAYLQGVRDGRRILVSHPSAEV